MSVHCDYCGDTVPARAHWSCSHCPATYCSAPCRSHDFRDHSQVCSGPARDDTFPRVSRQRHQDSRQPGETLPPQLRESTSSQLFTGHQESKVYNSRVFYSSKYPQPSYSGGGHFKKFPPYYTTDFTVNNNVYSENDRSQSYNCPPPQRHCQGLAREPPPPAPPQMSTPQHSPGATEVLTDSGARQPVVKEPGRASEVTPGAPQTFPPSAAIKPSTCPANKRPAVAPAPAPAPVKSKKISNNLFSVLNSSDSSSDEETEGDEDENEDSLEEIQENNETKSMKNDHKRTEIGVHEEKKTIKTSVESKAPENVLKVDQKKVVPGAKDRSQSDQMTKAEKKKLKKQRQRELAAERGLLNAEKKQVEEKTPPAARAQLPAAAKGTNRENPPNTETRDQKKKLKKQRQKEKAAQVNEEKFWDYVQSIEKEISLKKFVEAEVLMNEALQLRPQHHQKVIYELRYKMYMMEEKYDQALRDLKKLIENGFQDMESLKAAVDCCLKTGNLKEFNLITKLPVGCKFAFLVTAREKMSAFERWLAVARQKESCQSYRAAGEALAKCVQAAPASLKLRYLLAKNLALDKRPVEARQILAQSTKIAEKASTSPNLGASYNFVLGLCAFYEGNLREAERCFLKAGEELREAEPWVTRTTQMRKLGEAASNLVDRRLYSAGLSLLEEALKIGQDNEKFMEKMMDKKAHIYFLMKDYESSRDILNQVIRINPKADVSLFHRGIVLIELADYEGAVRDLKEAFKLCPTDGYRTELNRAEKLLKTSIEQGGTDHYKTLGVDRSGADLKNIKNKKLQNAIIFFHFLKYPIIIFI